MNVVCIDLFDSMQIPNALLLTVDIIVQMALHYLNRIRKPDSSRLNIEPQRYQPL